MYSTPEAARGLGRSSYHLPGARVAARAQRTDYDLAASVGK